MSITNYIAIIIRLHNKLIESCVDVGQCVGNIFYQPNVKNTALKITKNNNIKNLHINPVTINSNGH